MSNEYNCSPQRSPALGESFNSRNGSLNTNVAFAVFNPNQELGSVSNVEVDAQIAVSNISNFQMSKFDLSLSAHYLGYNASGAVSKFDMIQSSELDVVWYISFERNYVNRISLPSPRYSEEAQKLINDKKWDDFFSKFGDHYVSSLSMGHKVLIRYKYRSNSSNEKNEISALVQASISGMLGSGEFKAGFKKITEKYQSSFSIDLKFLGMGGDDFQVPEFLRTFLKSEFDYDKIRDAVINYLGGLNDKNATVLRFEVNPYPEILSSLIPSFDELLLKQFTDYYFEVTGQIETLKQLISLYSEDLTIVENLRDQAKARQEYLYELIPLTKKYFEYKDENEKKAAIKEVVEKLQKTFIIKKPPLRIWKLQIPTDNEIYFVGHLGSERYAEIIPFPERMINLLEGNHKLHIVGTMLNENDYRPQPPVPLDIECFLGGDIILINGNRRTRIQPPSGNYYYFDFTVPFTPSNINPDFYKFRVFTEESQIKKVKFNRSLTVTFIP